MVRHWAMGNLPGMRPNSKAFEPNHATCRQIWIHCPVAIVDPTIFWYQRMLNESMQFLMHYDYNDFVARPWSYQSPLVGVAGSDSSSSAAILTRLPYCRNTLMAVEQRIHFLFLTRRR